MSLSAIQSSQRKPRLEVFRIDISAAPTGTAAQSTTAVLEGAYRCTVLKTGTGALTINFNKPFSRKPVVTATAFHASTNLVACVTALASTAISLTTKSDSGSATNPTELHVHVVGFDSTDQLG